jgi:hypothetical protein
MWGKIIKKKGKAIIKNKNTTAIEFSKRVQAKKYKKYSEAAPGRAIQFTLFLSFFLAHTLLKEKWAPNCWLVFFLILCHPFFFDIFLLTGPLVSSHRAYLSSGSVFLFLVLPS